MNDRISIPTVGLYRGMERLLASVAPVWNRAAPVSLDFGMCSFLSAQGATVLASMKLHRDCLGIQTRIDWDTVPFDVSRQLGRWRIAGLFGRENERRRANAIPLLHQPIRRPRELVDYIEEWVIGGEGMPRMTGALAKETRRAFCEVFGNVFRHAESLPGGIAVGQLYPIVKRFQLCVCDAGVGMVHRVQGAGFARESPTAAIQWALERGNSTWKGVEPPGLGLYLLREFVKVNGGIFRIYANNGCYSEFAGKPEGRQMADPFPGTLIELRLDVRDDVTYDLRYT